MGDEGGVRRDIGVRKPIKKERPAPARRLRTEQGLDNTSTVHRHAVVRVLAQLVQCTRSRPVYIDVLEVAVVALVVMSARLERGKSGKRKS